MLNAIVRALEKTNNINRSMYTWNAINAVLSAMQAPLVLMVITRTNGINDAGVFSIAFAVANLLLYVGLYGLRRFQASDINEEYSFRDYQGMRFITCSVMLVAIACYCFYGSFFIDYTVEKTMVVFLVCLLKVIQAYTDVVHGNMQQKGRLDVATKCSAIRYTLEVLSIAVVLIICQNLLLACVVSLTVSIIVTLLTTMNAGRKYCDTYRPRFDRKTIKRLAVEGFALFLSLFLNMYVGNAPKYAIDAYLTEEVQAIYNILFMPTFMILLLTNFIFNPIIKTYAELWLDGAREKRKDLFNKIKRQSIYIAGLTLLGLAVAATIGAPILSLIFGVDVNGYKKELCVIMLGGGALAYITFFTTVITIIREQKKMMFVYGAAALLSFALSRILVVKYFIMGAATLYTIIMVVQAVLLGFIMISKLKNSETKAAQ